MSKVFLFQEPVPNARGWTPNLASAAQYGAIEFIFDKHDRPSADPVACLGKVLKKLSGFDPEKDYVCWANAGDISSVFLVMPYLTKLGFSSIKALLWQKDGAFYLPTEIPLNPRTK